MKRTSTDKVSETDWERVGAMRDETIDFSDSPKITPSLFARAVVKRGLQAVSPKELVSLRVDKDVLEWFRARGKGYQTEMNALLREYMQAHLEKTG